MFENLKSDYNTNYYQQPTQFNPRGRGGTRPTGEVIIKYYGTLIEKTVTKLPYFNTNRLT